MQLNKLTKLQKALIAAAAAGILLMLAADYVLPAPRAPADGSDSALLEEKIAVLIKNTYSLSDVSVILTYDTTGEKITTQQGAESQQSDGFTFSTGNDTPFVISEKLPYVRGALISATQIDDDISEDIKQAVATLLGINPSKVNVIYPQK